MSDTREWPTDLVAYKRTPDFTENTIPDGLRGQGDTTRAGPDHHHHGAVGHAGG